MMLIIIIILFSIEKEREREGDDDEKKQTTYEESSQLIQCLIPSLLLPHLSYRIKCYIRAFRLILPHRFFIFIFI